MVIGAKALCSILFFEIRFPTVPNKKNAAMSHSEYVTIFFGIPMVKKPACPNVTVRNSEVIKIEKTSKRHISLSDLI